MNEVSPITVSDAAIVRVGTITYYPELIQGSEAWLQARCGLLTASEMKLIITPTLKTADNDKCRTHLWELLSQRINKFVEPHYISDDMLRGKDDEVRARIVYAEKYAPVEEMGFITNNEWGFTLGFSPDGLVGEDGFTECKSRRQKYQTETIVEHVKAGTIPAEYIMQVQTGFLVSKRKWCDFISYSGGSPMAVIRVYPDPKIQDAIVSAAATFEAKLAEKLAIYRGVLADPSLRLTPTERVIEQEMV
jgi:YqaJ-like viral recombinase domain